MTTPSQPIEAQMRQFAAQLDELSAKNTELERRLRFYELHGLKDLASGTGNQRFGAGKMQTGPTGIQVKAASTIGSVWFVEEFDSHLLDGTSTNRIAYLYGRVSRSLGVSSIALRAVDNLDSPTQSVEFAMNAGVGVQQFDLDANGVGLTVANNEFVIAAYLAGLPFGLADLNADPSLGLVDGWVWSLSTTNKFRGRQNGATDNFAMEGWVTSNTLATGAILGAYKDADQEVTSTTLTADSELTVTLAASSKYQFSIDIFFLNDGAAEGYKVALSGTVGIQDLKAQVSIYDDTLNALVAFARITAIDTAVGGGLSIGSNFARVVGSIETTTAGTFLVKFAQNAAGINAGVHHEIGCSMTVVKVE